MITTSADPSTTVTPVGRRRSQKTRGTPTHKQEKTKLALAKGGILPLIDQRRISSANAGSATRRTNSLGRILASHARIMLSRPRGTV